MNRIGATVLPLLLFVSSFVSLAKTDNKKNEFVVNKPKILLEKGTKQYNIGSYNTAMDYFMKLLAKDKKKKNIYYKKALFMLAKTYMKIGRKTGNKEYLWRALNLLQFYFNSIKNPGWDFYYTKANIYENLGFYDKSLNLYRVAFLKAKTDREQVKTTIGILRSAVFLKRPDIIDEYYILLSTKPLKEREFGEVEFLRGLILFSKNKYNEAFKHFFKTYKKYESYLIENPEYYYLVAEDIYRKKDYKLAEQLFKRIASLTRSKEVIRKALLRLGDTYLKKENENLAIAYYYELSVDYPNSREATIAKLKLISLMENDPKTKYKLDKTGIKTFREPFKFVITTLIHSRDSYIGPFALGNFGLYILKNPGKETFKQLKREVSLIFPEQLKYEQIEHIKSIWTPLLQNLPPEKSCELYKANPNFFKKIFGRDTLLSISKALKICNEKTLRINLIKYIADKWKGDENLLVLAEALSDSKDFKESMNILKRVKNKNCKYYGIYLRNSILMNRPVSEFMPVMQKNINLCENDKNNIGLKILFHIYTQKPSEAASLIEKNGKLIKTMTNKNPIIKLAVYKTISKLIEKNNYKKVIDIANLIDEKNCFFDSVKVISFSRIDRIDLAKKILPKVRQCEDTLSKIAETVYEDQILYRKLKR